MNKRNSNRSCRKSSSDGVAEGLESHVRDGLTGLYNHRFFQEKCAEELERAGRYRYPLSCLMIDIDHFGQVNDRHGLEVGDWALKELAGFLMVHVRRTDTVARFGGKKFAALLPHVSYAGAQTLAERLRTSMLKLRYTTHEGQAVTWSVSVGISSYPEDPIDQKGEMLFFAEKALDRAKAKGHNQVCLYDEVGKEFDKEVPSIKWEGSQMTELRRRLIDISEMSKRAYIEATKALINALEAKDRHTLGHAARVGQICVLVAQSMELSQEEIRIFEHAGLLHDIGKICVDDAILLKPSALSSGEYEEMKEHPLLGYQIVKPIKFLSEEANIILHHHEWFNGKGYPDGLKGGNIPLGARIVSAADSYDTMRLAGARYQRIMTSREAAGELIRCSGTQFDPEVVFHFVRCLVKKGDLDPSGYDQVKLNESMKLRAA